ncbi:hypothetical protein GALL_458090 [mine drainage metagenome]|uniref:Uncharacterized protein n=1 Tax=mine drainage metagenome TaxID=410659 RepID=A0A1J5PM36_9ZZZZ
MQGICFIQANMALQLGQPQGCTAQGAGHPDVVSRPRGVAPQRHVRGNFAEDGDAHAQGAARGVAADQLDIEVIRAFEQAVGKGGQPGFVSLRQRDREQGPARQGSHGGEVGKVDRQRFPAELARIGVGEEVRARYQHVGGDGQFHAGGGCQQCGIVADAQYGIRRGAGEMAPDEGKFRGHQDAGFCADLGRNAWTIAASVSM